MQAIKQGHLLPLLRRMEFANWTTPPRTCEK